MKKVLALTGLVALVAGMATATQPIPNETFNAYTVGPISGQGDWAFSGTDVPATPVNLVAGSLTYTTYATSAAGNSVFMGDTGQDVGRSFAAVIPAADGNTYYYSLLVRHDGTDVGTTAGDYIAHFTGGIAASGANFRGRLFLAQDTVTATSARIGLRYGSADTINYGTTAIPANTTALIVVKVTEVAGPATPTGTAGNDTAAAFIFLDPNPVPASEPTAEVTAATAAGNSNQDIADSGNQIGRVGLRQGNAAAGGKYTIDNLRVGTTWAEVTSALGSNVSDWTAF